MANKSQAKQAAANNGAKTNTTTSADPSGAGTTDESNAAAAGAISSQEPSTRRRAEPENDKMVLVEVPRAFKLQSAPGIIIDYPAGTYEMKASHADHNYTIDNGVKRVKASKAE